MVTALGLGVAARTPNAVLLVGGTALTFAGMVWLSRAGLEDSYVPSVALPMVLVGAGQGLAFAPLTNAGLAGVAPADAGAASGLVNTAHQLGMALGLGILVSASAHAAPDLDGAAAVAEHVRVALTGSSVLLAVALLVTVTVILPRPRGGRGVGALSRWREGRGQRWPDPLLPLPARTTSRESAGPSSKKVNRGPG